VSVAATHPFDRDTALEPLGEGLWRGRIQEHWWVVAGPFGGYVSSFFTRALQELVPDRSPRSLTVHFLSAPEAGDVEVSGRVERIGGSMTSVSLRMTQDGKTVATALAAAAAWRDGEAEWAQSAMPLVAPPEECTDVHLSSPAPRFFEQFDIRFADDGTPVQGSARAYNAAWLRQKPGRVLDHLGVTALADGWMPASFSHLRRFAFVPTLDLTIHFRAPLPHDAEWALVTNTSRLAAGGVWDEDTEVWAPDGTLLAQARQLAIIRG
jgi:acyl-CoA thioesterase